MGCVSVNDGKDKDNTPTLLFYVDESNEQEQKKYCEELTKKWNNPRSIKYEIRTEQKPFKILFKVNGKEILIQENFDNSESAMNETLGKAYDLLK